MRAVVFPAGMADEMIGASAFMQLLPQGQPRGKGWIRVATPADAPPDATCYRYADEGEETDLLVAADGRALLSLEQRTTWEGELEKRVHVRYEDWAAAVDDENVLAILRLPRPEKAMALALGSRAARANAGVLRRGQPMPGIAGYDLDGERFRVPAGPTLYFFSFIACKPCKTALNQMAEADFDFKSGARLVYVNGHDSPEDVARYLAESYGTDAFDVLMINKEALDELGVVAFPKMIYVGADGTIRKALQNRWDIKRALN